MPLTVAKLKPSERERERERESCRYKSRLLLATVHLFYYNGVCWEIFFGSLLFARSAVSTQYRPLVSSSVYLQMSAPLYRQQKRLNFCRTHAVISWSGCPYDIQYVVVIQCALIA